MSWLSEATNAVADGASDGVAAVSDGWDSATGALSDAEGWITAEASASWDALESGAGSLFDPIEAALGSPFDLGPNLDQIVGDIEKAAEIVPDVVVDVVSRTLAEIPEQVSAALAQTVEIWDHLLDDVDQLIRDVTEEVVRAVTAIEQVLESTLAQLSKAIEQAARLLDLVGRMLEAFIYFLERVLRCIVDVVAILGGCLGGIVGYYIWKATIVTANALKPISQIPSTLKDFLTPVFPEFASVQNGRLGWLNIWLVDNAFIPNAMGTTFVGVTYKGIRLSSVIYVTKLDLRQYGYVSNVAHECEHVRQMTRFVSEEAFACAYGAGWSIGGGYRQNPFESAAFQLECRQRDRILAWVSNVGKDLYENPCNKISHHDPCSRGFN
jgi:hypothetical protein